MKKLISFVLLALLVFSLFACGDGKGDEGAASVNSLAESNGAESSEEAEASVVAEGSDAALSEEAAEASDGGEDTVKALTVNGCPINDYVIVYTNTTELATYEAVAIELQEYIEDSFGAELAVQSESSDEVEKEIILGHTSKREICNENNATFDYGGYKLVVDGSKVLIESDYATGCYQGYKALIEKIEETKGTLTDFSVEGTGGVIKVACVGDSITQGINSTQASIHNYPRYLQQMLGLGYYVMNAGITDRSVCSTDVYYYGSTLQHALAVEFAPDVVIFNLGTNDANPAHDYKSWTNPEIDRKALFKTSVNGLLDEYASVNEDVQIFICLPSSLFVVDEDKWSAEAWTANIVEYVIPLLNEVAEERGVETVDFFNWSIENPEVFVDGLHPKDETYLDYAQHMYEGIKDSIKRP